MSSSGQTQVAKTELAPPPSATPVETTTKSALAADKSSLGGSYDNNGALMGVTGAKFIESKPPVKLDEQGLPVKYDANGHPVLKETVGGAPGASLERGTKAGGAGDSYRAMSEKLEQQRREAEHAAQKHQAEMMKAEIVRQIQAGEGNPELYRQLGTLNRDFFNLPADHTGY